MIRVCPECGVIAPLTGRRCEVCDADHGGRPLVIKDPQVDHEDVFWVAIRCEFQCRSCAKMSPVNHLDIDGDVTCLHCGISQAFDAEQWREALDHAHAVGDLAGPDPEGRLPDPHISIAAVNPMRSLGVERTVSEHSQGGIQIMGARTVTKSLKIQASPGHPVDDRGDPLRLRWRADPEHGQSRSGTALVAGDAQDEAVYVLPPEATSMSHGLCAVIAPDHRVDRPAVRLDLEAVDGALRCPSCGAPLRAPEGSRLLTCVYCSTPARIPEKTLAQLGDTPSLEMWWLGFRGPSALRMRLTSGTDPDFVPLAVEKAEETRAFDPRRFAVGLVVPLLILAAVGIFGFGEDLRRWFAP